MCSHTFIRLMQLLFPAKTASFFPHEFLETRNLSENDMDVFYHRELQRRYSEREKVLWGHWAKKRQ